MKTCKKCGCVYDNSFDKCPTCNYTINKEINKELFRGCLNGLIIFISIIMSISSSSAFPFILGIIICIIISSRKFAINTNQNENNTINLHLKNNVTLHETFCASLKKELTEKQKENKVKREKNIKKLKKEYMLEEFNIKDEGEIDFKNFKYSIYEEGNNYFEKSYQNYCSGEREYFLLGDNWCYFTFDEEKNKYYFKIEKNKTFSKKCRIDFTDSKTKQLIKYLLENPSKKNFYEGDLKKQINSGKLIKCKYCGYRYHKNNTSCPNCEISTKENIL